ncbi:MAG: hypothetical protein ABFD54_15380 [Armatimonadota bacterium]
MYDLECALAVVLETVREIGLEQAGIINALGRTLAEQVQAKRVGLGDEPAEYEIIVPRGTLITSREMGALASIGKPGVAVSRKPRVAVVTTGPDVVELVEKIGQSQVRNSVRYELVGMVLESGCDLGRLVHVRDYGRDFENMVSKCSSYDLTIIAIGPDVSYESCVKSLGSAGTLVFDGVCIEPGSATAFGTVDGKPVFVTPWDSVLEVFEALIRPALLTMLGRTLKNSRSEACVIIDECIHVPKDYWHYVRAITSLKDRCLVTHPIHNHRQWSNFNSIIKIPPDVDDIEEGQMVDVIMLGPLVDYEQ